MPQVLTLVATELLLLAALWNFFAVMTRSAALDQKVRILWQEEFASRQAAEWLAAERNISDGSAYLQRLYRGDREAVVAAEQSLKTLEAGTEPSTASNLPFHVEIYRQVNPAVPDDWPNWFIKFQSGGGK
jgi:hypothetical protein